MFKSLKTLAAAGAASVLLATSAVAGSDTTPNAPPVAPAVIAAAVSGELGIDVNVTFNAANGTYTLINAATGAVIATISSPTVASILSAY